MELSVIYELIEEYRQALSAEYASKRLLKSFQAKLEQAEKTAVNNAWASGLIESSMKVAEIKALEEGAKLGSDEVKAILIDITAAEKSVDATEVTSKVVYQKLSLVKAWLNSQSQGVV